ncbi:MAG: hypothetical protein ABI472_19350 [Ginsengibacter sp.]
MKQTFKTTKMITLGLFTFCVMGLSNTTFAVVKTDSPAELKFIGKVNNNPVFLLSLHNDEAGAYFVSIKDESSNVFYSEKLEGADLSRRYQLDIDQADLTAPGFGVSIEVTSAKTHKTTVYKISSQTSVTQNIVVAKL